MTLGEACSKGLVKSEKRMSLINWDITLVLNMAMKVGHPKNCLKNHIEKSRKKLLSVSVML